MKFMGFPPPWSVTLERRDTPVKSKRAARSLVTSFEVTYEHGDCRHGERTCIDLHQRGSRAGAQWLQFRNAPRRILVESQRTHRSLSLAGSTARSMRPW